MMDTKEAHGTPFSAEAIHRRQGHPGRADVPFTFDPELPHQMVETLGGQRSSARRGRPAWPPRVH